MPSYQQEAPLLDALVSFCARQPRRLHVPFHGGVACNGMGQLVGEDIFKYDVTELPGLDDLGSPTGVIARAQELAARLYGARRAFFLVNGTTVGLQAAVMSACRPGQEILLPRNTHRSLVAGVILTGAKPVFLSPRVDPIFNFSCGVARKDLDNALKLYPRAAALVLVHPNYYGVAGDMPYAIKEAHGRGLPVLADQAHGAHLAFCPGLPPDAVAAGADVVAMSMHKTGGSLTQSSLLHISGSLVDPDRVASALSILQTSSPSYPLMASLDAARHFLATRGKQVLQDILDVCKELRDRLEKINGLSIFNPGCLDGDGAAHYDPTRLVLSLKDMGIGGSSLASYLARRHNIYVEMADYFNVVLVMGMGTTKEICSSLERAIISAAGELPRDLPPDEGVCLPPAPVQVMSPREAWFAPYKDMPLEECAGEVCAEWVAVTPPGIPCLLPGELVTQEVLEYLKFVCYKGLLVSGPRDPRLKFLRVVKQ